MSEKCQVCGVDIDDPEHDTSTGYVCDECMERDYDTEPAEVGEAKLRKDF